ncbi:MAG: hypothetical protein MJ229_02495 [bacterium]|nr:hypothetical protein [bacterium]
MSFQKFTSLLLLMSFILLVAVSTTACTQEKSSGLIEHHSRLANVENSRIVHLGTSDYRVNAQFGPSDPVFDLNNLR